MLCHLTTNEVQGRSDDASGFADVCLPGIAIVTSLTPRAVVVVAVVLTRDRRRIVGGALDEKLVPCCQDARAVAARVLRHPIVCLCRICRAAGRPSQARAVLCR